jgi:hypothetical protein
MAQLIQLTLSNIPSIMFGVACMLALLARGDHPFSRRLLDWMLLLGIGVSYVWGGFFHVFFPDVAASSIGWANSPFQYEIGVADIAIGITAITSFWRSREFKAAVVAYIAVFSFGVTVGHVYQAIQASDYAPNNFGLLLLVTITEMIILPVALWITWRKEHSDARA